MKIVFYYPSSLWECGGITNWIFEVSEKLSKRHEINIVGLKQVLSIKQSRQRFLRVIKHHVNYHEFPSLKPPLGVILPHPFWLNKLVKLFDSSEVIYTIVPSHPSELLLYLLHKCIRGKIIAGFHGSVRFDTMLFRVYLPIFKYTLNAFQAYHALNYQTYLWLKRCGYKNIFYIPNGVNSEVFQLCDDPAMSETFNILYVGLFMEYKGIDILLEIGRRLNKSNIKDIKLIICGAGPLEFLVKKAARECSNIEYLGFICPEDVHKVYKKAHLFLLPSRMEGMPLSLLEAQSCGLPFVASNIPGISDISANGENGILVSVGDVKGFINAIKRYYHLWCSSSEEYRKLNINIRNYIVNKYDWKIVIDKFEKMLKEIMNLSRG